LMLLSSSPSCVGPRRCGESIDSSSDNRGRMVRTMPGRRRL
jgi:hypothetical protein